MDFTSADFENLTMDSLPIKEQNFILYASTVLPIARLVHAQTIDPKTVTHKGLAEALNHLTRNADDGFEFHVTPVAEEMRLVEHCLSVDQPKSAIVLLFALIEVEVNFLIRVHMRIRGFNPNSISETLQGTSFDIKLGVLLRLLGVSVPERFRNTALQCKSIRNVAVHNKAKPSVMTISSDEIKRSETEVVVERANSFFTANPIDRLHTDLVEFVDNGVSQSPDLQWANRLFEKHLRIRRKSRKTV
jgi:hypothetical protein